MTSSKADGRMAAKRQGGRLPRAEVDRRIQNLLEIALEEFAANGFGGTSLDRLVQRSGVSKTTILRRFGSKEGMFRTLVDQNAAAIRAGLWAIELDPDKPLKAIEQYVTAYTDVAVRNPLGHALLTIAMSEKRTFPTLGQTIMTNAYEGLRPVSDYIEQLMDKGILRRADPREAALDLQGLITHGFRVMVDDMEFLCRPGRAKEIAARFLKGWS